MSHPRDYAAADPDRYGVYLRPDPRTCLAVTTITSQLKAQYGLVSAAAFPPHATLAGTVHIDRPQHEIVTAISRALTGVQAFGVVNSGVRCLGGGLVYDVHHRSDGTINTRLTGLAERIDQAVGPLRSQAPNPALAPFDPLSFSGHLSLASHDLFARPDLAEEVEAYIGGLGVPYPPEFTADTLALYRTRSADWTGRWWTTLEWTHVQSWTLAPSSGAVVGQQ